jgi:hypothetical protein
MATLFFTNVRIVFFSQKAIIFGVHKDIKAFFNTAIRTAVDELLNREIIIIDSTINDF